MKYLLSWRSKRGALLNHVYDWSDDAQAERLAMMSVTAKGGELHDIFPLGEGLFEKQVRLVQTQKNER